MLVIIPLSVTLKNSFPVDEMAGSEGAAAVIVLDTTGVGCDDDTLYVPIPPVPVNNDVIVVPGVTPDPLNTAPTVKVPRTISVTVKVVVEIDPVKVAATDAT